MQCSGEETGNEFGRGKGGKEKREGWQGEERGWWWLNESVMKVGSGDNK